MAGSDAECRGPVSRPDLAGIEEPPKDVDILGVRQLPLGQADGPPGHLVDFGVGWPVPPVDHFHGPESDNLDPPVGQLVLHGAEVGADAAPVSGLLLDFTPSRTGRCFPIFDFALGETPVVVAWAMDHRNLQILGVADYLPYYSAKGKDQVRCMVAIGPLARGDQMRRRYPSLDGLWLVDGCSLVDGFHGAAPVTGWRDWQIGTGLVIKEFVPVVSIESSRFHCDERSGSVPRRCGRSDGMAR